MVGVLQSAYIRVGVTIAKEFSISLDNVLEFRSFVIECLITAFYSTDYLFISSNQLVWVLNVAPKYS